MMEEVSHPEEAASIPPLVETTGALNPSPPQQQLSSPPKDLYNAQPMASAASPGMSPQLPPTSVNYIPQTILNDTPSTTYQSSPTNPPGAPASSTITFPDSPEFSGENEQRTNSGSGGMWGWISQNTFVQSVVEKTKTGVDRMITTLDPGMTPYLRQGGDIRVVVASDKEVKWGAVRDAFQKVFGMAQVTGVSAQPSVAPQPVGFDAGIRGAQDRISYLRRSGLVNDKELCVAVESFVAELLPDKWFDIGCVILDDPANKITLELFTQAVPVPPEIINHIQSATPSDYSLRWSGLAVTVGQAFRHHMPWIEPSDWHKSLAGQSRRAIIYSAVVTLAGLYMEKFPKSPPGKPI